MTEYKRFTYEVGLVSITNALLRLRGLLLIPILTKGLGAADYGIWSQVVVTMHFLSPLAQSGLTQAINRFIAGEKKKRKIMEGIYSSLTLIFVFSVILGGILYLSSGSIADNLFKSPKSGEILRLSSLLLVIWTLDLTAQAIFQAFKRFAKYSVIIIAQAFLEIVFIYMLLDKGFGLKGALSVIIGVRSLLFLLSMALVVKDVGFSLPKFTLVGEYLRYGLPLIPYSILVWANSLSDRYLIGFFMGPAKVGIYSAASNISNVVSLWMLPIGIVLTPTVIKLWEESRRAEVKTYMGYTLRYYLLIGLPSVFGLSILSKQILALMTNPEFVNEGSGLIPVLSLGTLVYVATYNNWSRIFALVKKTRYYAVIMGVSSTANIFLNVFLIPEIGVMGAAIATLTSNFVAGVMAIYLTRDKFTIPVDGGYILKIFTASCVMGAVVSKMNPSGVGALSATIIMGVITYFALVILLRSFHSREMDFFKQLFNVIR